MRKPNLKSLLKALAFTLIFFTTTLHAQNYAWTAAMGGTQNDRIHAIASDDDGNVYVCGSFRYTVDFDPGVNETNMTSTGNYDIFVQKLNAAGELLWIKTYGGSQKEDAVDMKLDQNGNIYITGYFSKTVDFDPSAGTNSATSSGSTDIFLQKLDSDGNFQWVKTWGSTSIDEGGALAIDHVGNIYTTGYFKKTIDFDLGAGTETLTAVGNNKNIFIQKLDSNGDFVWVKGLTGATCKAIDIDVDEFGNVFTTGYFTGTVDFNPNAPTENRTSRGMNDIFTQKLETNGNFLWASTIEGTSDNTPSALAIAPDGSVFVTGSFNGTADFDPNSTNTMDVATTGLADGFLQKLDSNGDLIKVIKIGGTKGDRVNDIYIDQNNKVWLTGYFHTSMTIDAAHGPMVSTGAEDVFIANYDLDGTFNSVISYGGWVADKGEKILYSGTNLYTIGTFQSDVDFDTGISTDTKSSNGIDDVFLQKLSFCYQADVPVTSVSATTICASETVNIAINSGALNSATEWKWREGSCNGSLVGNGTSISVNPTQTTTYYVGGEGGCITSYSCQEIKITVLAAPTATVPVTICEGASYTFPDGTQEDNITSAFAHSSVFNAASGCDSTIVTEITLNPTKTTEQSTNICVGESFTFADGTVMENIQTTTNYNSTFESAIGCDSIIVQTVIPTTLDPTLSVNGNTLSTPLQKATYQWIDCAENTPISGETGSTFTPSHSGEYAVIITSTIGCSVTSSCQSMSIVGTLAPGREKQFDVYPNPMTTILNVAIRSSYKEGSLTLYHITGQRVYAQNLNGKRQIEIDVNDLTQGAYYLEIITDGVPAITKVIK